MSVAAWISASFQPNAVYPPFILDELYTTPPADLSRYSVFRGHFGGYLESFIGRPVRPFTTLRNPVARTISHWSQILRTPRHPDHDRVRHQSLDEFVSDERNRIYIQDFQARYIARPELDLQTLASGISARDLENYRLSLRAEEVSLAADQGMLFERASAALSEMEVIGTVDDLAGFLEEVAAKFGVGQPGATEVPHVNRTDGQIAISNESVRAIERLTEVDRALYESAASNARGGMRALRARA